MSDQREQATLDRLLGISYRGWDPHRQQSQLALFWEYMRRIGLWYAALDRHDAHPIVSDLPGDLIPGIKAKPVNATLLQQSLRTLGHTSVYERMLLTRALDWAVISTTDTVQDFNLPDAYEPLIIFYERGGWLNKAPNSSEWEISNIRATIDKAVAYAHNPPLDLSPAALDALDQSASA